jgi:hypothetical protein
MLTGQQGLPTKPFDPLGELKRLRRRLATRIQNLDLPGENDLFSFQPKTEEPPPVEPVSLESVVSKVGGMKRALTIWQRSRFRERVFPTDIFRGNRRFRNDKGVPSVVAQYLSARQVRSGQERTLEIVNAGLMALGVVGVVFGCLSLFRGWESDLSLGSLVSLTGTAIIAIGLGGRLFASSADCGPGR